MGMMIQNHDTLKQRSMELKKENMRLRKELNQTKRLLENNGWERTLHEQNLKNDIQILETKLCHNQSRLKDKLLEIEELKKILSSTEMKVEEMRNKYDATAHINGKYEAEVSSLKLYNQTLSANIQEHKDEIKALRQTMDAWYDKHGLNAVNNIYEKFGNSSKSELVNTLKMQNSELRKKIESSQENILSLKEQISILKQENHSLSDRYESTTEKYASRDSQIEQLRETLSVTQHRESNLMKELTECKMENQKFKVEAEQFQSKVIETRQYNEKLEQQIAFFQLSMSKDNQNKFEQFAKLTNKLEIASKNAAQFKVTNHKMHEQIEFLKNKYGDLHNDLVQKENEMAALQQKCANKKNDTMLMNKYKVLKVEYAKIEEKYNVIAKKYEILKKHWDGMNKDRSKAIEMLKSEEQRVSESEKKLNELKVAIAELNSERTKLEKDKHSNQHKLEKLSAELQNKQIELQNVDEEKLKWKARTDRLAQAQQKVSNAVIMNEVKVQEEIQLLKAQNDDFRQKQEQNMYEFEDLQNKNTQLIEELNEWKLKYDEINEKYEFESGQHDNTLKKLNDIRSVMGGETNLEQLLQIKQQNIQELQSKIT